MKTTKSHGADLWSSREWLAQVTEWIDAKLQGAGRARTGAVEQVHLRPWGTVLEVPSDAGSVWFKAAGPGTAFEVALYDILASRVPERVLVPIAADAARAWVLLPDGGPSIGKRLAGAELGHTLAEALVHYGELQRALAPRVDDLLRAGVWDMRPSRMLERFDEALAVTSGLIEARAKTAEREMHAAVCALRPTVTRWCERLMESALPATLDHNDLHPWNILGDEHEPRFYDWGDSVVAHPFAAMLVPFGFLTRLLDTHTGGAPFVRARRVPRRLRDACAARGPRGNARGGLPRGQDRARAHLKPCCPGRARHGRSRRPGLAFGADRDPRIPVGRFLPGRRVTSM